MKRLTCNMTKWMGAPLRWTALLLLISGPPALGDTSGQCNSLVSPVASTSTTDDVNVYQNQQWNLGLPTDISLRFDVSTNIRGIGERSGRCFLGFPGTPTTPFNVDVMEVSWARDGSHVAMITENTPGSPTCTRSQAWQFNFPNPGQGANSVVSTSTNLGMTSFPLGIINPGSPTRLPYGCTGCGAEVNIQQTWIFGQTVRHDQLIIVSPNYIDWEGIGEWHYPSFPGAHGIRTSADWGTSWSPALRANRADNGGSCTVPNDPTNQNLWNRYPLRGDAFPNGPESCRDFATVAGQLPANTFSSSLRFVEEGQDTATTWGYNPDNCVYAISWDQEWNGSKIMLARNCNNDPATGAFSVTANWQWLTAVSDAGGGNWNATFGDASAAISLKPRLTDTSGEFWHKHVSYPSMTWNKAFNTYLLTFTAPYAPYPNCFAPLNPLNPPNPDWVTPAGKIQNITPEMCYTYCRDNTNTPRYPIHSDVCVVGSNLEAQEITRAGAEGYIFEGPKPWGPFKYVGKIPANSQPSSDSVFYQLKPWIGLQDQALTGTTADVWLQWLHVGWSFPHGTYFQRYTLSK